jgi:hypothetical protein
MSCTPLNDFSAGSKLFNFVTRYENNYFALNPTTTTVPVKFVEQILLHAWNSKYTNNDSLTFIAYHNFGFYLFDVKDKHDNAPRLDKYRNWINGTTHEVGGKDEDSKTLSVTYFYHRDRPGFK